MRFTFQCPNCNHELQSSGRVDHGMLSVVEPYICSTCKDVVDVLVGRTGLVILKKDLNEEQREEYYRCYKCKSDKLKVWNKRTHPCPKCGQNMITTNELLRWD